MSDSMTYSDSRIFMAEDERKASRTDRKFKALKFVVGALCLILLVEVVLYTVIIPSKAPVKISFSGLQMYSPEEMCHILNTNSNQTWSNFDSAQAAAVLADCPWIESVSVEKKFPDSVAISVKERVPVAATLLNINGKTIPVQIDESGVLFTAKTGASISHLPLISGLPVESFNDGMRLPSIYKNFIEQLAKIQRLPQKYLATISEIHVNAKEYGGFDLILYPVHSHTRVLMDRTFSEDSLQYMVVVLDVVNSLGSNIYEIDLRYGSVSFRTRVQ
ncbi:MAG: FtsQ-type POTRA domain-containing protein [Spirochaetaceae bacterium]|nr:FtsQ-type POTRA domain-containing protein [Spirochaetaceae bacterium]